MASQFKIIVYDLCKSGKNYDELYEYFATFSFNIKITDSTRIVSTSKKCKAVRDEILDIIDSDDRVFVGELNGNAAWSNIIGESSELKKQLENKCS